MRLLRWCSAVAAALLTLAALPSPAPARQTPAESPNLIANPGLEEAGTGTMPNGWETLSIGPAAQFAIDTKEMHGGGKSVRITASEVTRSYLRTGAPIPVAPGERIRASARVKVGPDTPPDRGTVIVIAEFSRAVGQGVEVAKVGVADVTRRGWQKVEGTVTVPPLATNLRLRLGFSYSQGTVWWDDVSVHALSPLAIRVELPDARFSPGRDFLPVAVLNRTGSSSSSSGSGSGEGAGLRVRATLGNVEAQIPARLTNAGIETVVVPLRATGAPGRRTLAVSLLDAGGKTLFAEERTVTIPPPLTLLPVIPTHGVIEDGAPRIAGEVDLAVPSLERHGGTLSVTLVQEQAGKPLFQWRMLTSLNGRDEGRHPFEFKSARPLKEGTYRIIAEFTPAAGAARRAEQPWHVIPRSRAKVTLSADGYPVHNGKAVFPLGIFNGGARMAEAGRAGFTVSHAYNAVRIEPGETPNDQRAKDFLDSTEKAGMKALFLVPMPLAIAGEWEGFRRRIRMFRNHPALLAWDEEEGLARGDLKPEMLEKIRAILKEEDPHHPFMIGDARDVIGRVTDRSDFFPARLMDMGMWWWYPLPAGPKASGDDALAGEEAAKSRELVPPGFLTLNKTGKPLWVGVQSYKKPGAGMRYPTPAEYRAQAYVAIIHGAKGLMWYGGSVTGGLFLSPQEGNWEYLKTLAGELNTLVPVFMAPSMTPPAFEPAQAPISVALKRLPDRLVLLAANRGAEAVDVSFVVPGVRVGEITPVVNENRGITITAAGRLTDRFEPYAVHVYELPAATLPQDRKTITHR